jgi:hypothetical protein
VVKDIQAKHIDDVLMLQTIFGLSLGLLEREYPDSGFDFGPECWVFTWDVEKHLPRIPYKVLMAKLSKLVNRGLLEGCACGCRGDFYLTPAGRALLTGTDPQPRP